MLQIRNYTPFHADRAALVDRAGNQIWVVVVKATYDLHVDGSLTLAPEQEPVCRTPIYAGAPGRSSLLREAELVPEHPGTDVTVLASAHAPGGRAVTVLDVAVSVGDVRKIVRVFGDRVWRTGALGGRITEPAPFTRMPIVYERAFGGGDAFDAGSDAQEKERRNPIGAGFATRHGSLDGRPLPNIEDPADLIQHWDDRPRPAGFGPIPPMWSPRSDYGGTFDDEWSRRRMPLLPVDYDPRHAQSAHPDLVSRQPLKGGEQAVLTHLTPSAHCSFRVPRAYLSFTTLTRSGRLRQEVQLDRLIVEPDAGKVVAVWRSSLNCRARVRDVRETVIEAKVQLR